MKELLLKIKCDYCGDSLVVPAEQPSAELMNWIIVVSPDADNGGQPAQKYFCKRSCAINFLRLDGPIIQPVGLTK